MIIVHTMATITVHCDGKDCHEEETLNVPINKVDDLTYIRDELYDAGRWGWGVFKGKLYCSNYCQEKSND